MKATCYLQVEPEFHWNDRDRVIAARVKRVTQKRPDYPIAGSLIVKLNLEIADAAFEPLTPEATVVIPVEHTEAVLVETEPVEIAV